MKKYLNDLIKKLISLALTQETGNSVGGSLFKFRNKQKWLYNLIYGTATDEEVFESLVKRLGGEFEILMIHSSLNGMIPMYRGNPARLLSMLLSFCREKNITLVMPTFIAGPNYQAIEHYRNGKNIFDVRKTMSEMGMLSELFRIIPDVKRSLHPSHSICAFGPLADKLTGTHHLAPTTFGEGTPFEEMIRHRTIILGIGIKSTHSLSQIHAVEDMMKEKYPVPLYSDNLPVTCINEAGNVFIYNLRVKNPEYTFDPKSFYKIMKRIDITDWSLKGIPFYLTDAENVTKTFIKAAEEGITMYKRIE